MRDLESTHGIFTLGEQLLGTVVSSLSIVRRVKVVLKVVEGCKGKNHNGGWKCQTRKLRPDHHIFGQKRFSKNLGLCHAGPCFVLPARFHTRSAASSVSLVT